MCSGKATYEWLLTNQMARIEFCPLVIFGEVGRVHCWPKNCQLIRNARSPSVPFNCTQKFGFSLWSQQCRRYNVSSNKPVPLRSGTHFGIRNFVTASITPSRSLLCPFARSFQALQIQISYSGALQDYLLTIAVFALQYLHSSFCGSHCFEH